MTCQVKGCERAGTWIPVFRFYTEPGKMVEGVSCRLEVSVRVADTAFCLVCRDDLNTLRWSLVEVSRSPHGGGPEICATKDNWRELYAAARGTAVTICRKMMVKTDGLELARVDWERVA